MVGLSHLAPHCIDIAAVQVRRNRSVGIDDKIRD
jgi:hypothetical protein